MLITSCKNVTKLSANKKKGYRKTSKVKTTSTIAKDSYTDFLKLV